MSALSGMLTCPVCQGRLLLMAAVCPGEGIERTYQCDACTTVCLTFGKRERLLSSVLDNSEML